MAESLNSFLFSTPEMTRVFSPLSQLRSMMRFELALTQSLERSGLAASGSSQTVETLLDASFVDIELLERQASRSGNIAIPFVGQLTAAVKKRSEPASLAIHLGATSQDLLDTAVVLQIADALPLLEESIARLDSALVKQVRAHAETVLSGRTWLQPGPPTTFGLKLAGTLAALRRDHARLRNAEERCAVLQFGGAVGTLASLGESGARVSSELAKALGLREPDLPWHTQRDRLVEAVQVLAILTGTLAKFARDISLLMQVEVAEAGEESGGERGGSSTMPHKHNPVSCAAVIAIHTRMPGLVSTMLHAMVQEHERGLGFWQAEWETIPRAFELAAASLGYAIEIAESLQVNTTRMRDNIDSLLGTTMSEAVATTLGAKIGRAASNALLRESSTKALNENRRLSEVLKETPEVVRHLTSEEIDSLLAPCNYLGSARRFIAAVLGDEDAGD